MLKRVTIPILFSLAALNVAANPTINSDDGVIDYYRYSVIHSSVSDSFSENQKKQLLQLIQRAEEFKQQEAQLTAQGLLNKVARQLYAMQSSQSQIGDAYRYQTRKQAMESLIPVARMIAQEKDFDLAPIQLAIAKQGESDLLAKQQRLYQAYQVLDEAYIHLTAFTANMRSGEVLKVSLPKENSAADWQDSERRYVDWRYLQKSLIAEAFDSQTDKEVLADAIVQADLFYADAKNLAQQQLWQQAVEALDGAYLQLQGSWSAAGLTFEL